MKDIPEDILKKESYYPKLHIENIKDPSRLYAFPILGGLIKIILFIPITIEFIVLTLVIGLLLLINAFVVLFTGHYWSTCLNLYTGLVHLETKSFLYWVGLTNKYPGFDLQPNDAYKLELPEPKNPNRLFAVPLLGFIARLVLMIPYFIYSSILMNGLMVGLFVNSFYVLFKGKYAESIYELGRDQLRVNIALGLYLVGISDKYPHFWISMHHKTIKITLLVIGTILAITNQSNRESQLKHYGPKPTPSANTLDQTT